jgi:tRNA A-37 threonylcarbamoyl transferase component Bud32
MGLLTLTQLVQADQERRWAAGQKVAIEEYFQRYPQLRASADVLVVLLFHEFRLREQAGEHPHLEELASRFPEAAHLLAGLLDLHRSLMRDLIPSDNGAAPASEAGTGPPVPIEAVSSSDAIPIGNEAAPTDLRHVQVPGYTVLGVLGKGGMGIVYKARQERLNRVVALKMILHAEHAGPEERRRFLAEAKAVARLQHPNIVQVHEVNELNGLPFFSLEHCGGGSLADKLDGTPWPATKAAELIEVLARATAVAHQAGIVHRDLKPANVLLTEDGTPKIADFGLVKFVSTESRASSPGTQTGAIMGTPSYMAPEQASGKSRQVGPTADVYALGVMLYELLTGRPPFKASAPLDTVLQVLNADMVFVRRLQPTVPKDLETICHKCLEKEPQKRYANARELADDLQRFLAGKPVAARRMDLLRQISWWCHHHDRIRDAGVFSAWMLLVLTVWLVCGVVTHAVGAVQRGSWWPFKEAAIPSLADQAILYFVGVIGLFFTPLLWASLGAIKGRVSALWLGLVVSAINVGIMLCCLSKVDAVLSLIDVGNFCAPMPVRFFAFAFPMILFVLVAGAYSLALFAYYRGWGSGTRQGLS